MLVQDQLSARRRVGVLRAHQFEVYGGCLASEASRLSARRLWLSEEANLLKLHQGTYRVVCRHSFARYFTSQMEDRVYFIGHVEIAEDFNKWRVQRAYSPLPYCPH